MHASYKSWIRLAWWYARKYNIDDEDFVGDCLLKLWEWRLKFDSERGEFSTFAILIFGNVKRKWDKRVFHYSLDDYGLDVGIDDGPIVDLVIDIGTVDDLLYRRYLEGYTLQELDLSHSRQNSEYYINKLLKGVILDGYNT